MASKVNHLGKFWRWFTRNCRCCWPA